MISDPHKKDTPKGVFSLVNRYSLNRELVVPPRGFAGIDIPGLDPIQQG